jgi:hypothetical protein
MTDSNHGTARAILTIAAGVMLVCRVAGATGAAPPQQIARQILEATGAGPTGAFGTAPDSKAQGAEPLGMTRSGRPEASGRAPPQMVDHDRRPVQPCSEVSASTPSISDDLFDPVRCEATERLPYTSHRRFHSVLDFWMVGG